MSMRGIMINKCEKSGVVIKAMLGIAGILIVNLFAVPTYAAGDSNTAKRLILFQGFLLNAYFNDQYIEVKRLSPKHAIFYGYGWLDDHRVFVAYQREGYAAAIADLEIIDLRQSRTTKLKNVGAGGESNFDVNPSTGEVVFTTDDAVKLLRVDAKTNAYRIEDVKNEFCWGVFWIDSKTIGCKLVLKDGLKFVKYSIPRPSDTGAKPASGTVSR